MQNGIIRIHLIIESEFLNQKKTRLQVAETAQKLRHCIHSGSFLPPFLATEVVGTDFSDTVAIIVGSDAPWTDDMASRFGVSKRDPLVTGKTTKKKVHAMSIHQSTLIFVPTKNCEKMASFS